MNHPVDLALLNRYLPTVDKPMRYLGNEWNAVHKNWTDVSVRFLLAYPDTYEVGMSNIGLQILYQIINARPDALCERAFAPWPDMEAALRTSRIPLYGLESRHPLADFDLIGFSLPYELNLTNVLNMLDLAGLPVRAADRDENVPLIIAGGSMACHPEPMADFIDAFVIGDGEEVILEVLDAWRQGRDKKDRLRRLAHLPGVYVPRWYAAHYGADGRLESTRPTLADAPMPVIKRVVDPLPPPPTRLIVPFVEPVHDRAVIEIMRGCTQGCRFCQAGMIYRPLRERPQSEVIQAAESIVRHTGYEEISLISLSSADHSEIRPMIQNIIRPGRTLPLSVTLPSLRTDAFSVELAELFQGARRSGLTFAPEAGSQRLRDVINKKVTQEDLLQATEAGYAHHWQRIKLYFMIGLPTETDQDMSEIVSLTRQVLHIGRRYHGKKAEVSVTVSTFVPKPHTPFQWYPLIDDETLRRRQSILHDGLRGRDGGRGIYFNLHDWRNTLLEAVIARGDRRLGAVIEQAWRNGAKFDAWLDQLNWTAWLDAFAAGGLDPQDEAHRPRNLSDALPWDHLSCGIDKAYLWREYEHALAGQITRDCREGCTGCGAVELLGCRGKA